VTRVVAGSRGGRRLVVPPGSGTRPTSDRAREALFNTLDGLLDLTGAAVLDLYAGSGALGLEALSRGAAEALFVESDRRAVQAIRANLAAFGLTATVRAVPVARAIAATPPRAYDVAFLDPPYALATADLSAVCATVAAGWLAPGGVLVVERSARDPEWAWPGEITAVKSRSYGEATLWYGRRP
jgi:16S rRNA (guanine966-N2)-methyltransferase